MQFTERPLAVAEQYRPNREKFPEEELERHRKFARDNREMSKLYHESTKLREHTLIESKAISGFFLENDDLQTFRLDHQPTIEFARSVPLPHGSPEGEKFYKTLRERKSVREYNGDEITKRELSILLHRAAGETHSGKIATDDGNKEDKMRAYPSGGGLYPVELYLVLVRPDGLSPGVYYYENIDNELKLIDEMSEEEAFETVCDVKQSIPYDDSDLSGIIFLAADFRRSRIKYGERGYKLALLEAGHICQNILLVATALGLGAYPSVGFYDDRVNGLLRIDGTDRAAIYSVCFGGKR